MDAQKTYIEDTTKWAILIIMSLLILAFPLAIYKNIPFLYILLLFTVFTALPFFLNVEKIIYLLTFYIVAFGIYIFKGNLYPVAVSYIVTDFILIVLFFLAMIDLSLNKRNEQIFNFSKPLLFFLFIVLLSFVIGLSNGFELKDIHREFRIFIYYAIYFVAVRYFNNDKPIFILLIAILVATLFAASDAIYTYYTLDLNRFVSRQVHLIAFVIPFLISLIILDRHKLRRVFYFVLLLLLSLSIIISQTRGTWFSLIIAIIISLFLSIFVSMKRKSRFLSLSIILSSLVIVLLISLNLIGKISQQKVEFVEQRVGSVTNLQSDLSLLMRINAYSVIINKIKSHPWFGNGLGSKATYLFFGRYSIQQNIDSTYLTILWKMGIIGLIAFILLYFLLLKKAFLIYRRTENNFHKIFSIGLISSFVGLLILGTISPILITSRFNLLFGVLFAITDVISQKTLLYEKRSNEDFEPF